MKSRLFLKTEKKYGATNIKDVYFEAPYKIMSGFVTGRHIEITQMMASAGLLGGDHFTGDFIFGKGSDVTYGSQSYEKVLDTKDRRAVKEIRIKVEDRAEVNYMPYPVIPFKNSHYYAENTIYLSENCKFSYCDIFACGRTGMGESYAMKRFESRTKIFVGKELDFADHTLLDPQKFTYRQLGMWGGYTHNGMLYLFGRTEQELTDIREMIKKQDAPAGISKLKRGSLVRILAANGEKIWDIFQKISR